MNAGDTRSGLHAACTSLSKRQTASSPKEESVISSVPGQKTTSFPEREAVTCNVPDSKR